MTIKNGDMPAMPLADSSIDTCESWDDATAGGRFIPVTGFTKREMIAMHIASGLASDHQVAVCNIATLAVEVADKLLAELERTK